MLVVGNGQITIAQLLVLKEFKSLGRKLEAVNFYYISQTSRKGILYRKILLRVPVRGPWWYRPLILVLRNQMEVDLC